ncbi:hypothetical protein ACFYZJ_10585 [Streptomyces sp. NPDC001848]|uniref:hypothetical protein n=1 Tax=Streptomyces sp. NPDC001848 TaxID=3364618 RepID=UPI0036ACA7C0
MSRSRRRRGRMVALTAILTAVPALWLSAPAAQANPTPHAPAARHSADTGPAVRHDASPTLRSMAAHARHGHHGKRQQDDDPGEERLPHPPGSRIPDPVVQSSPGGPSAPSTGTNFEGIGAGNYSITGVPPDPNAAVGSGQIVETVNTAYAVCSKSGATLLAPTGTSTPWSGFGGSCQSTNDGDAVVRVAAGSSASTAVSTAVMSGSAQSASLSAAGLPGGATASFSPSSVNAGGSSTLTVATSSSTPAGTYNITVTGTGASATHAVTYTLKVTSGSGGGITNGGFGTGTLTGWTSAGAASVVSSGAHSGAYAARVGSTSPTNGDSSIAQTFTAPSGSSTLGFYSNVICPDTVTYDCHGHAQGQHHRDDDHGARQDLCVLLPLGPEDRVRHRRAQLHAHPDQPRRQLHG